MEIAIFESVVIESALRDLEAEGEKYAGLYVDIDNAPERKYVKDKAAEINGLLKKIDRARIDASKNYKVEVEKQALAITNRLVDANSNFQVLIDDYNLERKKALDAKKLELQQTELLTNRASLMVQLADNYAMGVGASAAMRIEQYNREEAQIKVLRHQIQIIKQQEVACEYNEETINKNKELENQA